MDHKETEVKPKSVRWTTDKFGGKPEDVLDKVAWENVSRREYCTLSNAPEKSNRMGTNNWFFLMIHFRFRAYLWKMKFSLIDAFFSVFSETEKKKSSVALKYNSRKKFYLSTGWQALN